MDEYNNKDMDTDNEYQKTDMDSEGCGNAADNGYHSREEEMDGTERGYQVLGYENAARVRQEAGKKKYRFAKGFFCGVALTFAAVAAVIAAGLLMLYRSDLGVGFYSVSPQGGESAQEGGTFDLGAVEEKLSLLGMYIDQVYLYDYDPSYLAEGIYKGYMSALGDPYSVYYTAEEFQAMTETTEGSYYGIGVLVSQDMNTGLITVVRVFQNSPALEAGMEAGDIIYAVDGNEVTGQDLNTVVSQIKGEEGTTIPITVYRGETGEYLELDVERRRVEVDTVDYSMLEGQVGYIVIYEFDDPTAGQFRAAVANLEEEGMEALIVDVRDNPGGLVTSVVEIADELVPEGMIVYMENKAGERQEHYADGEYLDIPLALLINGESASASEILAGAVRDHQRGTLIGTNTYGKGIAQTIYPLGDGTALKLTTADYYTPSGENIHGKGIAPDIEVELDPNSEEDTQLKAAWEYLAGQQ